MIVSSARGWAPCSISCERVTYAMTIAFAYKKEFAFNAICPYYTMFPLEYPMGIIRKHRADAPVIVDPFCGRGTTIYAARRLGLTSYGFDTSPIAAAIA